jgi:serine/threonine-protein kinase RsbW
MGDPTSAAARGGSAEFVHRSWPADPRQLAPLRAEVRRWLAPLTLTGDAEDDLVLAVSEAASNSVEHAYTLPATDDTVELTFWTEPGAICVEIVDHGHWRTRATNPPDAAEESRSCSGSSRSC